MFPWKASYVNWIGYSLAKFGMVWTLVRKLSSRQSVFIDVLTWWSPNPACTSFSHHPFASISWFRSLSSATAKRFYVGIRTVDLRQKTVCLRIFCGHFLHLLSSHDLFHIHRFIFNFVSVLDKLECETEQNNKPSLQIKSTFLSPL